jgi:hypothetical protein
MHQVSSLRNIAEQLVDLAMQSLRQLPPAYAALLKEAVLREAQ